MTNATSSEFDAEFDVSSTEGRGGVIVAVSGEFDGGVAGEVADELSRAIESSQTDVLLDLAECPFIDSSGLQVLLRAANRLGDEGRTLAVCRAQDEVAHLFRLTGLDLHRSLNVYDGWP